MSSSADRSVTLVRDASLGARLRSMGFRGYLGIAAVVTICAGSAAVARALDDSEYVTKIVFYSPALLVTMALLLTTLLRARVGLTKLTIRFTPEGITEHLDERSFSHPWSWLTRFHDDDATLRVELGVGARKHVLVLDKRTKASVAKRLLVLLAEHAAPSAAQFERGGQRAIPTAGAVASLAGPRNRDLN